MFQRRNAVGRSGPPRARALRLEGLEDRNLLSGWLPNFTLDLDGPTGTTALTANPTQYRSSDILVTFRAVPVQLPGTTVGAALGLVPGLYEVQLDRGVTVPQALAEYGIDSHVLSAEPDYLLSASSVPNDPSFGNQWDLHNTGQSGGTPGADIGAEQAWNVTQGGHVIVAVMDTGIDYDHPDLYQNIWINQAEIPTSRLHNLVDYHHDGYISFADLNDPRNQGPGKITDVNHDGRIDAADILAPMVRNAQGQDTGLGGWAYPGNTQDGDTAHPNDLIGWNSNGNTNNPMDDNGHGTHVAGILGAMGNNGVGVAGVDWNVELMPIKFMDAGGNGSISQFIAGLNYAVAHGARLSNNSWAGAPFSQDLINAINNARGHGQIFVAAAGNDGANIDQSPVYPASTGLNNVVVVAATDNHDKLAGFSNYGPNTVAIAAPGVDILSTLAGGGYGYLSGTSMATPVVTGVLALVWGEHPDWSYTQVIARVLQTADKLPSLTGKVGTGGRVDAAAAVGANIAPVSLPHVVSATFSVPAPNVLGGARLTFDRAMNVSSFVPADVSVIAPGGRTIAVTHVSVVAGSGNKAFDITFANQTAPGTYVLHLTGGVRDLAGVVSQAYQASYTISAALTFSATPFSTAPPGGRAVSMIMVNQDFTVADLTVRINIKTTRTSTLYIHLQGPDGTDVVLAQYVGGSGQSFTGTLFDDEASTAIGAGGAPFSGTYRPVVPLSSFDGKSSHGYWKLWVEDSGGASTSVLTSWSLNFTPKAGARISAVEGMSTASVGGPTAELATAYLQTRKKGGNGTPDNGGT